MEKLKKCPFCGCKAELNNCEIQEFTYGFGIECTKCPCEFGFYESGELTKEGKCGKFTNGEEAVKVWNIRK